MKILLTDGSHKNTLAIIRYLGRENHIIDILHFKKSAPAYSKYCNKLIISPNIQNEFEYFEFVLNLVKNQNYDILIPVGIKSIEVLSKNLQEITKFVHIELSDYNSIRIALEKRLTFKYAEENLINHPKTIYPTNIEEAISFSQDLKYPLIIKSSNESISKFPTIYIDDQSQLNRELLDLEKRESDVLNRNFPIIQERIFGKGYGFFAIYQKGICKKIFMHERIRENPISGGFSTCARSYYDIKLLESGKKILDGLHWHGQAMVEFKKDDTDGEYKLIEINPKFWGSLELCLSSGMNFPLYLCEMAEGKQLEYSEQYNRNRIFLWMVATDGELYRLFQKPSDLFKVLFDLLRFNSRSDIWLTDIKPTIIQFIYFLIFVKNKIIKYFMKK
jgi:predicted ATP-grasp superfamily ATP-dependent carboligase